MDKKVRFRSGLYRFFLGIDVFFGILTLIFIFVFPPVGLIGVAVTVLYALVAISIKQSINGKKPILDLFREGTKTCRRCMKYELGKFMCTATTETEEAEFYDYFCNKYV